jgi:hypothetical protein
MCDVRRVVSRVPVDEGEVVTEEPDPIAQDQGEEVRHRDRGSPPISISSSTVLRRKSFQISGHWPATSRARDEPWPGDPIALFLRVRRGRRMAGFSRAILKSSIAAAVDRTTVRDASPSNRLHAHLAPTPDRW